MFLASVGFALPSAKLLSLVVGIMRCADRRSAGPVAPSLDTRVMHSRLLRSLWCGTLNA